MSATLHTAALVALIRAPQHGGGEAHGFLGVPNIVWQSLNLVLFLVLVTVLLKKPLASFFGGRKREVEELNRKAEADRRRAEELATEIQRRLAGIEVEIARLRTNAGSDAEAEQKELLVQAEADAGRIVARGKNEIDTRAREARQELTAFAGDLAVEMAKEILRKGTTLEDQTRLVAEGTEALRAHVPAGRGR